MATPTNPLRSPAPFLRVSLLTVAVLVLVVAPTTPAGAHPTSIDPSAGPAQSRVAAEPAPPLEPLEPGSSAADAGGATAGDGGHDAASDGDQPVGGTDPADSADWLAPSTVPGLVGGFVFGTLLSVRLENARRRVDRYLARLPFSGEPIRTLRAAVGVSGSPSTEPDDDRSRPERVRAATDELLPAEVRVRRLLEAEDGHMKQSAIVERTAWSKAKVSRLLSRMADDGDVRKVRLGRENLVCLPGSEPAILRREPTAGGQHRGT